MHFSALFIASSDYANVLSIAHGDRPKFNAYATQKITPVSAGLPTDPRTVADLDTPQGSAIGRICQMTGKTIRAGAMRNSGGLRIAANFAVNVIHYGCGQARC